ncbi:hypothetical protein [Algoriphagus sanaruensis]|uniref:Uncharacterized protein n=1 Tax=Algoriphagus sanaruensis TaxID=1727163 RepID=A0A142EPV8_9BACT|nr:hypothetical protein [Algoriphagus sanaruensis]AMQ57163.1 hypothetical protein AO498_12010 [Algoriphagus sanaruensis]
MQETWTFDFVPTEKMDQDLVHLISKKEKELGIFLTYYFKKEGAVVEKVRLFGSPEFESKFKGVIKLEFDLVFFNACLAISENNTETIKINFEIEPEIQKIILTGPYWPSREMDEI